MKLSLNKETITKLSDDQMKQFVGGLRDAGGTQSCCNDSCNSQQNTGSCCDHSCNCRADVNAVVNP